MSQSQTLTKTAYLLRFEPQDHKALVRKAALYTARTGEPMTLAAALREGARLYLDELLAATDGKVA
jgi:hypothetical protein